MFTKRTTTKLIAAALVFAAFDYWIWHSLRDSFRKISDESRFKEIALFARAAPEDLSLVDGWLATLPDILPGSRAAFFLAGADGSVLDLSAAEDSVRAFWEAHSSEEAYARGLESAYYLEPYMVSGGAAIDFGDEKGRTSVGVYFAPIPDESGFNVRGAIMVMAPGIGAARFETLLLTLCLLAWAIFTVLYGVSVLSRDPVTGYGVIILFALALLFVAYPLFESVRLTFMKDGAFSLETWKTTFSSRYLVSLWGSVRLGIWTASFSTLIGFACAFLIERTSVGGKKFISTLATMPVISPPFSLTLSIILLFGNNGLITRRLLNLHDFSIYGIGGLVLVQTIGMFPIAFLTLSSVLKSIDSTVEDAALDLRASRPWTFLTITLPLAMPGVLSAWLLVFTNSLADFANPLLLAGSYRVLSVDSYIEVTGRNNLGGGAALSLLLLLPSLTAFFAQRYWVNRKSFVTVTGKPSTRLTELASPPVRIALTVFVGLCLAFIVALYGTIVAGCFVKNWGIDYSFTLANIGEALSRGAKAIRDTVILSAIAAPIAGFLAMAAALLIVRKSFVAKRLLEGFLMTPFAVPGTLVGISYVLAFNKPPFLLVGTAAIIAITYVIRELPVGLETGSASLRQIDPAIEEAAQDLGADVPTVFRTIVLPLLRPAFISTMSYTFVRSMTAVSAIIFLISARWYHLTVQIYNFSENLRFGLASVLATALIIIVLVAFGVMRLLVRDEGLTEKTVSM
ncbi:MAG: ABC transporter permease [Treponema sp. GWB1_62_6]|nr:MAG: ABC transporter permease [Treponema sp. GWB1_62_6]